MAIEQNDALWNEFLISWPPERVRQMQLNEYTNLDRKDAFIYWIEFRLRMLGSIVGGTAFKFGVFHREDTATKAPSGSYRWGDTYAWHTKYGESAQAAFSTIRGRLVEVIEAAQEGNFARVEEIDLAPAVKWKVAFHYQDRDQPGVLPIFKKEALFHHYRSVDPAATLDGTPYTIMYQTLIDRHAGEGDVIDIARKLWTEYTASEGRQARAWVLPLRYFLDEGAIEPLVTRTSINTEDLGEFLPEKLIGTGISPGDHLVMLVDGDVRGIATLSSVEPGQIAWTLQPFNFASGLTVSPSDIRMLDLEERQQIWSQLPPKSAPDTEGPRYWKIAPGPTAIAWPEWQAQGVAAIGWPSLGDLSELTPDEVEAKAKEKGYSGTDPRGLANFRNLRPGDRIVANQGKSIVVGVGTVIEGYRYAPGTLVKGEDYVHQVKVRWDDITRREVPTQNRWLPTVVSLSAEEFEAVTGGVLYAEVPPPAARTTACRPSNVILYGPPGTGKTYSTVRRALELILGKEKLKGLGDETLITLFRNYQAKGQIEFVTFHQAYGYEEFVEGIRPALGETAGSEVRYELHDGTFKRIALRAAAEGLQMDSGVPDFEDLWIALINALATEEGRIVTSGTQKSYRLELTARSNVVAIPGTADADGSFLPSQASPMTASKENVELYWRHRAELGPEPEKFSYEKARELMARERGSQGGHHYTAILLVYGQILELSRSASGRKGEIVDRIKRVQQAVDKAGPTTSFEFTTRSPQYVLIIDEINRGNISKILGELITLLEPEKRLRAESELKLPLAYSPGHRFAVPPNLHILGTMNTADRSIALMDVALRRRFTFEELMPDSSVIRQVLRRTVPQEAFIDLVVDLFETLNSRIRFLYDRDHQLGHAYFLGATTPEALRQVFIDRVIPLLQEYFYGSWEKIAMVLGCPYDEEGNPRRRGHLLRSSGKPGYLAPMVSATLFAEEAALGFDHDEFEDRLDFTVYRDFQEGTLSLDGLLKCFLGVLNLDQNAYETRLQALLAELAPDETTLVMDSV